MSKDRLQQILVDLIIMNERRINTQNHFSNYMKEEKIPKGVRKNLIILDTLRIRFHREVQKLIYTNRQKIA